MRHGQNHCELGLGPDADAGGRVDVAQLYNENNSRIIDRFRGGPGSNQEIVQKHVHPSKGEGSLL